MFGLSKRNLLARTLDVTGFGRALRAASVWRGVLALNYHRVGDASGSPFDHNLWSVSEADFEHQVATLAKQFDVIGVNDLDTALRDRRGRFVMLTFDDGYRDNYSVAYPILKSHGIPATFFIATGFIDQPKVPWWDEIAWMVRTSPRTSLAANRWIATAVEFDDPIRERAFGKLLKVHKKLRGDATSEYLEFLAEGLETGRCPQACANEMWMTWDMIREMRKNGMNFGGHTVDHPILANVSPEQQEREIGGCQQRLAAELGEPIIAFSYPDGKQLSFNEVTQAAVLKFGYRWAFTFLGGYNRPGQFDETAMTRTAMEVDIDLPTFRAKITLPQIFP